jgi:hypothetical protein
MKSPTIIQCRLCSIFNYEAIFRMRRTGRKRVIKARKRVAVRPHKRASPSEITDANTMSSLHCITTTKLFLG